MLLTLIRDTFTPSETLGKLYIDRKFFCDTIEPPVVPNAQHPKGCIPLGWYKLQLTVSPKFGRLLPLLYLVPGFQGIRIHAGNNRDHTSGCILVGELYHRYGVPGTTCCGGESGGIGRFNERGAVSLCDPIVERGVPTLSHSKLTEQALVDKLKNETNQHEELYINVTDTDRYPVERAVLDGMSNLADCK